MNDENTTEVDQGATGPRPTSFVERVALTPTSLDERVALTPTSLDERVALTKENETILRRHGLTPTSLFTLGGPGDHGQVFRVEVGGHEAAAKIIKDPISGAKEVEVWDSIFQFTKSAPAEVSKHFPEVFKIIEDDDTGSIIIVLELLKPMPAQIWQSFFDYAKLYNVNRSVYGVLKDYEAVLNAIENAEYRTMDKLTPQVKEKLFLKITSIKPAGGGTGNWRDEVSQIRREIRTYLDKLVESGADIVIEPLDKVKTEAFVDKFVGNLMQYFGHIIKMDVPSSALELEDLEDMYEYSKDAPEIRSLLEAMRALISAGIRFEDIHIGNLLVRPGTGDIIFSDVGDFKVV